MRLIDTHCHFDFPPFCDTAQASLRLAQQHGVDKIVIPAVSADRFSAILTLIDLYSPLYASLGLHPIYTHSPASLETLAHCLAASHKKVVAVGEIGLDFYLDKVDVDQQITLCHAQLMLAKQNDLPVILHARHAQERLYLLLKQAKLPRGGVIHGFSGSFTQAQQFIRLGYFIGVGGTITYERANKTRQTIAALPLDRLVLETDAPDMPIQGYQGQPNRPERIVAIFTALCQLRTELPAVIAAQLYQNSTQLFDFS